MIKQIVQLCKQITDIKEKVKITDETEVESEEEEDEDEKLDKIKQAIEEAHKKADEVEKGDDLDDDDDLDDSDYEQDFKNLWKTEIEKMCEFNYLKELLNFLFTNNVNWYNEIIGNLTEEEKNILKLSIEKAEIRQEKVKFY